MSPIVRKCNVLRLVTLRNSRTPCCFRNELPTFGFKTTRKPFKIRNRLGITMLNPVEENKVKNLHKKLHRSFKTLQECIPVMKTCAGKQESLLKELCIFCEQYRECQMAVIEKLQFPPQLVDVKPKILHMIVEQINKQLKELRTITSTYKKLFDRIHNCKMQTFKDLPQINYLTRPNRTFPTLAVMLEWLDDSERELFHQNEFLDSLNFKDETLAQKCKTKWLEEDTKIIAKFEERLAYLHEFLDET